jgi:hypothetical protein
LAHTYSLLLILLLPLLPLLQGEQHGLLLLLPSNREQHELEIEQLLLWLLQHSLLMLLLFHKDMNQQMLEQKLDKKQGQEQNSSYILLFSIEIKTNATSYGNMGSQLEIVAFCH